MAQEAHDQAAADAQFGSGLLQSPVDAPEHHANIDPARRMRLRIKKEFGVAHLIGLRTQQISPGHVKKVLLVQQNAGACIINVEEGLQIGESIGRAQGFDRRIGQFHAIAFGQGKDQFRLERTLDMDVQFGLGHVFDQFDQGEAHFSISMQD